MAGARRLRYLKWLCLFTLMSGFAVVAVAISRAIILRSHESDEAPAAEVALDPEKLATDLAGAVHIETISHSVTTDHERAQIKRLREYLGQTFPKIQSSLQWEEHDGNLVITWGGSDPALKPLLLIAHMDVVPATDGKARSNEPGARPATDLGAAPAPATVATDSWEDLAFSADPGKTRPFIYGRGTLDDKVSVVAILEAVDQLLADGFAPRRTVLLAFGRDEEVGGTNGAVVIARLLKERGVAPECLIDEGSYVLDGFIPGFAISIAPVGIAEKGYVDVEISVSAQGGHSSMPPERTAIGILALAINRLENQPMPSRIDGVARQTIAALGPELPFLPRLVLVNEWLFGGLLRLGLARAPATNALIRTTAAVTLIDGGTKDNVLPQRASAIVNLRPLPGDTSTSVLEHIRGAIDDPRVEVAFADPGKYSKVFEASRISPSDSHAFAMVRATIRQTFPGVVVAPFLVIAGTDARHYADLTENVYRFLPLRLNHEDLERIHGDNERISRDQFVNAVAFYYRLVKNFDR